MSRSVPGVGDASTSRPAPGSRTSGPGASKLPAGRSSYDSGAGAGGARQTGVQSTGPGAQQQQGRGPISASSWFQWNGNPGGGARPSSNAGAGPAASGKASPPQQQATKHSDAPSHSSPPTSGQLMTKQPSLLRQLSNGLRNMMRGSGSQSRVRHSSSGVAPATSASPPPGRASASSSSAAQQPYTPPYDHAASSSATAQAGAARRSSAGGSRHSREDRPSASARGSKQPPQQQQRQQQQQQQQQQRQDASGGSAPDSLGSSADLTSPASPALSAGRPVAASAAAAEPQRSGLHTTSELVKSARELDLLKSRLSVVLAGLKLHTQLSKQELEGTVKELSILLDGDFTQTVSTEELAKAEEICDYMLRDSIDDCITIWFGKSEETDAEIWSKFGEYVIRASDGRFDHWTLDVTHPRLLLAWVIMLDQFRRNMFRNQQAMYLCDASCQMMVLRALDAGLGELLDPKARIFLCLVLTHSEDIDHQIRCVAEWGKVEKLFPPDSPFHVFRDIFERHVAVVERFGRFPHRNEILKRPSTPPEVEFLSDDTFRFDLPLKKNEEGKYYFDRSSQRTVSFLGRSYTTSANQDVANDAAGTDPDRLRWDNPDRHMVASEQLKQQSNLRIGDLAPNFSAQTTMGPINFYDYIGDSWAILFSHPADFTPVCTTELGHVARLNEEGKWSDRDVKVLALSVDNMESHHRWVKDLEATAGCPFRYPLIDDHQRRVSMLYGMLDKTLRKHGPDTGMTITVRSVFVVSPEKRVELILTYPAPIGRDFGEIFRAVRALQLSRKFKVATPVNWRPGMDTVVLPFIADEVAEKAFSGGIKHRATAYLRYVADPEKHMARERAQLMWRKLRLIVTTAGYWKCALADLEDAERPGSARRHRLHIPIMEDPEAAVMIAGHKAQLEALNTAMPEVTVTAMHA